MEVRLGVESNGAVAALPAQLEEATERGQADFLVVPLAHPRYTRDHRRPRSEPFTRSDLLLNSVRWNRNVVGTTSPWLQLDSPHEAFRRQSEAALRQEIAWACHLTLDAVILPSPTADAANYAHTVHQLAIANPHLQFLIRVPLCPPEQPIAAAAAQVGAAAAGGAVDGAADDAAEAPGADGGSEACNRAWRSWNRLRCLCEHACNIGMALEFGIDIPEDASMIR